MAVQREAVDGDVVGRDGKRCTAGTGLDDRLGAAGLRDWIDAEISTANADSLGNRDGLGISAGGDIDDACGVDADRRARVASDGFLDASDAAGLNVVERHVEHAERRLKTVGRIAVRVAAYQKRSHVHAVGDFGTGARGSDAADDRPARPTGGSPPVEREVDVTEFARRIRLDRLIQDPAGPAVAAQIVVEEVDVVARVGWGEPHAGESRHTVGHVAGDEIVVDRNVLRRRAAVEANAFLRVERDGAVGELETARPRINHDAAVVRKYVTVGDFRGGGKSGATDDLDADGIKFEAVADHQTADNLVCTGTNCDRGASARRLNDRQVQVAARHAVGIRRAES